MLNSALSFWAHSLAPVRPPSKGITTWPSSDKASTGGSRRLLFKMGASARMRMPVAMIPMRVVPPANRVLICSPVFVKLLSAPSTRPSSPQITVPGSFSCNCLAIFRPLLLSSMMALLNMGLHRCLARQNDDGEIGDLFWRHFAYPFDALLFCAGALDVIGVFELVGLFQRANHFWERAA